MQDDLCLYVNPKMLEIFGYDHDESMRDLPFLDLVAEKDRKTVAENLMVVLHGDVQRLQFSFQGRQHDGSIIDIEAYLSSTEFCGRSAIIGSLQEVTERRLMEEAIRHQAYHDSLTSLPNRILFNDRLSVALMKAKRDKKRLAVMFLDLDRFKSINDTLGHTVGDMLLQSIAGLLRGILRESDTVARLGGDEYTILLSQIEHEEDAVKVAQKILSAVSQKWVLDGHRLHLTTSIGIGLYPQDGEDVDTLLKKADTAMYDANSLGGNTYRLYHPAMDAESAVQLRLENDLRLALENDELIVWYQPLIESTTRRLTGMEALIRWNHPDLGLILPKQFIPLAEKTGLIVPIGAWVLESACRQARSWRQQGSPHLQISVNISGIQLNQPDFVEMVEGALRQSMLPASALKLEITESIALQNLDAIVSKLDRLTGIGVDFSIDDFGMGYSSLNYLRLLPIKTIKIDRSFMHGITLDEEDSAIVTAIIAMAKSLNLDTVVEGVETEEQMRFLDGCHCDTLQGFLFSEPLPPAEFEKIIRG
jgi:diguanylate cyclase (GGDEF)-like protein/PAS domain S-box-containing protein